MNERYGKVLSFDPTNGRFRLRLQDGTNVRVLKENLEMGMKQEEMSEEDEQLLLGLKPTSQEIRSLPWRERMQATYGAHARALSDA